MHRSIAVVCSIAAVSLSLGSASVAAADIVIPTVPIGNPGNAPDPLTGFGSVAYSYNIGTTEVTNAQYAAFLNAVAATDTHSLYNTEMAGSYGGITRSGSDGSYTYATISGRANNPVAFVSALDACRFINWLHNGQGDGDTETGAYTLTPDGFASNPITRNAGALWALPTENEWYKAAYHQPAGAGGPAGNYWLYPTQSNTVNTSQANYFALYSVPVGSYAPNYYGAFDMGGNVGEFNEGDPFYYTAYAGVRGGSFDSFDFSLRADQSLLFWPPYGEDFTFGFRVVQLPGPGSAALLAFGGLMGSRRRR